MQPQCTRMYKFIEKSGLNKAYHRFEIFFIGEEKHTEVLSTQLKGEKRKAVRIALKNTYASDFQNILRRKCNLNLKSEGNLSDFKSLSVLDQVRHEALSLQDDEKDDYEDLKQKVIDEQKNANREITMHFLTFHPFKVFILSNSQMDVLIKYKREQRVIRCGFDATSNVVKAISQACDPIYYYAGVVNIKNVDRVSGTNFTFMELLSSKQTSSIISFF